MRGQLGYERARRASAIARNRSTHCVTSNVNVAWCSAADPAIAADASRPFAGRPPMRARGTSVDKAPLAGAESQGAFSKDRQIVVIDQRILARDCLVGPLSEAAPATEPKSLSVCICIKVHGRVTARVDARRSRADDDAVDDFGSLAFAQPTREAPILCKVINFIQFYPQKCTKL